VRLNLLQGNAIAVNGGGRRRRPSCHPPLGAGPGDDSTLERYYLAIALLLQAAAASLPMKRSKSAAPDGGKRMTVALWADSPEFVDKS